METFCTDTRPLLIFDGHCTFCVFWVRHWHARTGDAVRYEPFQTIGGQFPEIAGAQFQRAVQFIENGRPVADGAEACFRALAHAPGKAYWLTLYRRVPGFAAICERAYAFIAEHRSASHRASLWLWGRE